MSVVGRGRVGRGVALGTRRGRRAGRVAADGDGWVRDWSDGRYIYDWNGPVLHSLKAVRRGAVREDEEGLCWIRKACAWAAGHPNFPFLIRATHRRLFFKRRCLSQLRDPLSAIRSGPSRRSSRRSSRSSPVRRRRRRARFPWRPWASDTQRRRRRRRRSRRRMLARHRMLARDRMRYPAPSADPRSPHDHSPGACTRPVTHLITATLKSRFS